MNTPTSIAMPPGGAAGLASTPATQQTARRVPKGVVAATVAGNALEFYDFVTYAFFAVYIGKTFFPASTPLGSLLLSVAVFGVGFVSRPFGGVLIGAFADRAGRRPAMLLTIALITVGTLGLALTPSYESIGLAAPIIVVVCRLVQGLALGGDVGPSTAFLVEAAPPERRGLYGSWQMASQGMAILVAGLLGLVMVGTLTPQQLQAWGWRVPFLAGLLLVPVALYLRASMPETLEAGPRHATAQRPRLFAHTRILLLSTVIVLGGTVSNYVGTYMTTYAIHTLKLPPLVGMTATVVMGVVTVVFGLVGGWIADRWGRKPAMLWARIAIAVTMVPLFGLIVAHPGSGTLLAVSAILGGLNAITGGASILAIPEMLPRGIRATGLSIAYAIGVAIFGGSTQFVVTWLISATGNPAAPAWYVAATSVVTVLAILACPETRGRDLQG